MSSANKKLSIEERLSLAAKTRSKKKSKKASTPLEVPSPSQSPVTSNPKTETTTIQTSQEENEVTETSVEPKQITKESDQDLEIFANVLPEDFTQLTIKQLLEYLKPHFVNLRDELEETKKELKQEQLQPKQELQNKNTSDSSLIKLIKEKDAKIDQLLKEGENLSKMELKQSNTIKSLKKKIRNLETDLEIHREDLKDKVGKYESLQGSYSHLQNQYEVTKNDLQCAVKEKKEVSTKYEEFYSQEYQPIMVELVQCKELNSKLQAELQRLRDDQETGQMKFDIRYEALQENSRHEITRLESKLEQLRIELENTSSASLKNEPSNSTEKNEYDVLLSQYESLQSQLKTTNENWSSIEYSLNSKITELQSDLHTLTQAKNSLELQTSSSEKQIESLESELGLLRKEREQFEQKTVLLETDLSKARSSLKELQEDYKLLQEKYQIQKTQLENRILSGKVPGLKEDDTTQKELIEETMQLESVTPILDSFEHADEIAKWDFHNQNSIVPSENISEYGEAESQEAQYDLSDIPGEAADIESFQRKSSLVSMNFTSSQQKTIARNQQNNQMSAQTVSRLGAEVRRLETELSSLEESCEKLQLEKIQANDEIVKLMEENAHVRDLEEEKTKLVAQVTELQRKQETMLQLLGEKSERVEELENDVEDLKEMMHMQVQQIVELQEKLR